MNYKVKFEYSLKFITRLLKILFNKNKNHLKFLRESDIIKCIAIDNYGIYNTKTNKLYFRLYFIDLFNDFDIHKRNSIFNFINKISLDYYKNIKLYKKRGYITCYINVSIKELLWIFDNKITFLYNNRKIHVIEYKYKYPKGKNLKNIEIEIKGKMFKFTLIKSEENDDNFKISEIKLTLKNYKKLKDIFIKFYKTEKNFNNINTNINDINYYYIEFSNLKLKINLIKNLENNYYEILDEVVLSNKVININIDISDLNFYNKIFSCLSIEEIENFIKSKYIYKFLRKYLNLYNYIQKFIDKINISIII